MIYLNWTIEFSAHATVSQFLIVLLYVIVVLQGIIYNSLFALRWPWVGVCSYLEIIRLKTNDDYIEFPQVHNQILFDNTLIKLRIQNKEEIPLQR